MTLAFSEHTNPHNLNSPLLTERKNPTLQVTILTISITLAAYYYLQSWCNAIAQAVTVGGKRKHVDHYPINLFFA